MKFIQLALATLLVLAVPAFAQNHEEGTRSSGGRAHQAIPAHGPKAYSAIRMWPGQVATTATRLATPLERCAV
jgi:hypothetical protein